MNDLELIDNELPDKKVILVGGRRTGMTVNVGTILAFSAPPELPECLIKPEAVEKPYYRRFEKKRW